MSDSDQSALIVTLAIDGASAKVFEDLRQAYFPPHRNFISAHITLFHNLPGAEVEHIIEDLKTVAASHERFELSTAGVQFYGTGVAIRLKAPLLLVIRADLARLWDDWLVPQDRQGYRPHVTVQNKVASDVARLLAEQLANYPSMAAQAEGLVLWRYRGGPWDHVRRFDFAVCP